MDIVIASVIGFVFVLLPIIYRSNVVLIMATLSFGWVLNDITGNEIMLLGRSVLTSVPDGERFALLLIGFLPALWVVMFTKKSTKNPLIGLLNLGLMPGVFAMAWLLARASLPVELAKTMRASDINDIVATNQEYALWAAAVVLIMSVFLSRVTGDNKKSGKHKD